MSFFCNHIINPINVSVHFSLAVSINEIRKKNYIKIISNNNVDYLLQLRCWLVMMPQIYIYKIFIIEYIFYFYTKSNDLFIIFVAICCLCYGFCQRDRNRNKQKCFFFGCKIVSMKINRSI